MGTMVVRSVEQTKQTLSSQSAEEARCPERWPHVHVHDGPWPPALPSESHLSSLTGALAGAEGKGFWRSWK